MTQAILHSISDLLFLLHARAGRSSSQRELPIGHGSSIHRHGGQRDMHAGPPAGGEWDVSSFVFLSRLLHCLDDEGNFGEARIGKKLQICLHCLVGITLITMRTFGQDTGINESM